MEDTVGQYVLNLKWLSFWLCVPSVEMVVKYTLLFPYCCLCIYCYMQRPIRSGRLLLWEAVEENMWTLTMAKSLYWQCDVPHHSGLQIQGWGRHYIHIPFGQSQGPRNPRLGIGNVYPIWVVNVLHSVYGSISLCLPACYVATSTNWICLCMCTTSIAIDRCFFSRLYRNSASSLRYSTWLRLHYPMALQKSMELWPRSSFKRLLDWVHSELDM